MYVIPKYVNFPKGIRQGSRARDGIKMDGGVNRLSRDSGVILLMFVIAGMYHVLCRVL